MKVGNFSLILHKTPPQIQIQICATHKLFTTKCGTLLHVFIVVKLCSAKKKTPQKAHLFFFLPLFETNSTKCIGKELI